MAARFYLWTDVGAPTLSGTAGSLITVLDACLVNGYGSKVGAGWTKTYSGVNLAAYRMTTASPATGFYLRVDDTGATGSRVVGYETMSDVNTGTGAFPTSAQFSGGLHLTKSSGAGATARPWAVFAENRSFYITILGNSTTNIGVDSWASSMFFGDIISRKTVDGFNCAIIANSTNSSGQSQLLATNGYGNYGDLTGHYLARDYTGIGSSKQFGKCRIYRTNGVSGSMISPGESFLAYPDPVSQTWNLQRVMVMESSVVMRGYLPGLYDSIGGTQIANYFDIVQGQGTFSTTTFMLPQFWSGGSVGRPAIQISGDWY